LFYARAQPLSYKFSAGICQTSPRNAIIHHGRLNQGVHLITKPFNFADLAAKTRDVLDAPVHEASQRL
jgi:hypothetical protein